MLNGINLRFGLYTARKNGVFDAAVQPTRGITTDAIMATLLGNNIPRSTDPVGFYDLEAQRYVMAWISFGAPEALFWVMVSNTNDPTGAWTVTAMLQNGPQGAASQGYACPRVNNPDVFWDYPQVKC